MTQLVLIRHGETDWNQEGRWQGQADIPLNERGRQQAAEIALQLAESLDGEGMAAIYSSDLSRAWETAEAIGHALGLPVQVDPRLREIRQGDWEGLKVQEIKARYGEVFHRRRENPWEVSPPGGETARQVRARVVAAVEDILQQHPEGKVGIVSHGFTLAVIRAHYLGRAAAEIWSLVPGNCELCELEVNHGLSTGLPT